MILGRPTHGWSFVDYIDTDECTDEITPYDLCDQVVEKSRERILARFSDLADNLTIDLDSCDGPDEARMYAVYEVDRLGDGDDTLSDADEREIDRYLDRHFHNVTPFPPEW